MFQANYKQCESFIDKLGSSLQRGGELLDLFNLSTYSEFVAMELADRQTQILQTVFPEKVQDGSQAAAAEDAEEDVSMSPLVCKIADQTIDLCLMPLHEEHYYLPRVGDKFIKLTV